MTRQLVEGLKRWNRCAVWIAQVIVFALASVGAFLLRFDLRIPQAYVRDLCWAVPVWIAAKSLVFRLGRLDRGWWRYVSVADLHDILLGNIAGSALSWAVFAALGRQAFPRSIFLLDGILCFLATGGIRVMVRLAAEPAPAANGPGGRNTLVYGAGDAGVILLREIQSNPQLSYRVRGFIDDSAEKRGALILGVPVLGGGNDLVKLVPKQKIDLILIATPSATGADISRILTLCRSTGVACKTVPGLGEIIEGRGLAGQIRDVEVQDLLGRKPVRLESERIRGLLEGRAVLVTGAGGSIGSELCRQIARYRPACIVGFEIAESPLFEIDGEMRASFPNAPFIPEIGSIQNRARLDEVFRLHKPAAVFHAAAYKHVPMMEAHAFEAVENNVIGAYNVAMAAAAHGTREFVLISSDKAVKPANIMGATKRLAELLLLGMRNEATKYVAVRFGNVLGSNGSVVPIFKKQIAAGGPVTVTHPEMRRFFMTIPEACQLVLEAGAIGKSGEICVLNMGESLKIVDLARNLIRLSGLEPGKDIQIEFSGIRPGEKLSEELHSMVEHTAPTVNDNVRIYTGSAPEGDLTGRVDLLHEASETRDLGRLLAVVQEMAPEYCPSAHLLRKVTELERAVGRPRLTVYSRRERARAAVSQ